MDVERSTFGVYLLSQAEVSYLHGIISQHMDDAYAIGSPVTFMERAL